MAGREYSEVCLLWLPRLGAHTGTGAKSSADSTASKTALPAFHVEVGRLAVVRPRDAAAPSRREAPAPDTRSTRAECEGPASLKAAVGKPHSKGVLPQAGHRSGQDQGRDTGDRRGLCGDGAVPHADHGGDLTPDCVRPRRACLLRRK